MAYSIHWSERARRRLRQLDRGLAKRIVKKSQILTESPFEKSEPLSGSDFRKIRVGKERAIVEIMPEKELVKVILVDNREVIYKILKQIYGKR